ncbi:cupin domain-containing protein [Saccharospirillum sp. HFRX-1]|uniref:cupin domain-containing protein n=1 Tax=unclassified Saccharospirillum TaxID=2633430 RepID=UPI00371C2571
MPTDASQLISQAINRLAEAKTYTHPLNDQARRSSFSLGDATGLTQLGIHLTRVAPGDYSTEQHRHQHVDEFIYVLQGHGELLLDQQRQPIQAGDFIGMPAQGAAHALYNNSDDDLIYLVGGGRAQFDVCDYPNLAKRLYIYNAEDGRRNDFVALAKVEHKD